MTVLRPAQQHSILPQDVPAVRYNSRMSQTPPPDALRDAYAALPELQQQMAAAFVEFLRQQTAPAAPKARRKKPASFGAEPFAGMWKDNPEMQDSREYVRHLRTRQMREDRAAER